MLAGEITAELGDARAVLKAGYSVLLPRGVPHAWANMGDAPPASSFWFSRQDRWRSSSSHSPTGRTFRGTNSKSSVEGTR